MSTDTEKRRRTDGLAQALATYVIAALGIGGVGAFGIEFKNRGTTDSMLEQHTEALRERVDYLEEWVMRHKRSHMDVEKE